MIKSPAIDVWFPEIVIPVPALPEIVQPVICTVFAVMSIPDPPNPVIPRPMTVTLLPAMSNPLAAEPAPLPLTLRSSIVTSPRVKAGSADLGEIVPILDKFGSTMSRPSVIGSRSTAAISARSDPVPESLLFVT